MPELPEVEISRRGIAPHVTGRAVSRVIVRQAKLRWPIPPLEHLEGQVVRGVERRAKYLLLQFDHGTLILHLGMSGSLRVLPTASPPQRHDHFEIQFDDLVLRLRDPRRFGAVLWSTDPPETHPLLRDLGPEPLSEDFDGDYLYSQARRRRVAIKSLIMDGRIVVGVGNIYATEALFLAGIHPARSCARISRSRLVRLAEQIKAVLTAAIAQGGTTLRDFQREDGRPGYFVQSLQIYGRAGQACPRCGSSIKVRQIGQRTSAWCPRCQH
ncbi:MAG: bifunctional DNA-formamidopyrimidine glycosylase/DNA-(apurinic or apyrimidinic site) lyase [Gammaproteobacteria bacterium]|nr:MAG: bifunctional DNA-formamidopyrimidine glycosylase/DNA-(apurinic or apyrimidinic site) lyase [Gammaproteobacteria bacterium]